MDYFFYKDVLAAFLFFSYILYTLLFFSKRYIFKKKSAQIIKIPVARNTIQYILLIILTYVITIPVFTFYFSKGLRLLYLQFVDNNDPYLRRQGFFNDDYDSIVIVVYFIFYFFLIIKLILRYKTLYTIRKDTFLITSLFAFLYIGDSAGMGYDIRTYSHIIITVLFFLSLYFVVRNKVNYESKALL